jgi:long-chain fatty acid transport protein
MKMHHLLLPNIILSLILTSITLGASQSYAAFSNHNSVLIGERAAGMGGAFTALTGDPAATPYYNPATTVLLTGSSLSASVNVYNKYETTLGGGQDFTETPLKINRGFFRSIPSSSGTIVHFGSFAAGISIIVPDYEFYSGQIKGNSNTSSFLNSVDESLWAGGTFSVRLTEDNSVGASLYYTARNLTRSVSDRIVSGTQAIITQEEKNLSSNAVVGILGAYHRINPIWSIGASYRLPSLPIAGEASYYRSRTDTALLATSVINRSNLRAITPIPSKLTIGVAREIKNANTPSNTFSVDLQIHESVKYQDLPELPEGADFIAHRNIVNLAIGFEQAIHELTTVRIGFFTNLSSHPRPDPTLNRRQGDHVDMQGLSANTTFKTKDNTSFTIGGYYSGGKGTTVERTGDSLQIIAKSQQIYTMLIATGFFF